MRFLSLLAVLLLMPVMASGQKPVPLSRALEGVRWNSAGRGPLLCVDPEHVEATEPLPTGPRAASLSAVAPLFSRRIVPVGTLTVLAPETMVVLNTQPEQTAPRLSRQQALHRLAGTFTEAQWRKAGSDIGIGAGDMETDEQREYFRALVGLPLAVIRSREGEGEAREVIPANQLSGMRVRIRRTFLLQMTSRGDDGREYAGPIINPPSKGSPPSDHRLVDFQANLRLEAEATGEWIGRAEPNRLKPGDLDFALPALDAPISIAGVKTVGDAVKRCAAAARLELYADGRMARLPLAFRANPQATVRSGDLLKGLCWMLTGTFRKLQVGAETAWVLTDDRIGYGTRLARMTQARIKEGMAAQKARSEPSTPAVSGPQAWRLLSDSPTLPFAPSGEIRQILDSGVKGVKIPIPSLPDEIREQISKAVGSHRGLPLNQESVRMRTRPTIEYVVPGIGPISLMEQVSHSVLFMPSRLWEYLPEPGPVPAALPEKMKSGLTVIAAAKTLEAARILIQATAEKGIRRLWFQADSETVRAAVGFGREQGVAVGAVVSLLRADPDDTKTPRDRDIFGATSEWMLPEAPETKAKVQARLEAYAAIPGLAELVLTDTASPGSAVPNGDILADDGSEIGYTMERRLAYLHTAGFDPIDLVRGDDKSPLPFMQDRLGWDETSAANDPEMLRANRGWGAFRFNTNIALLRPLYDSLRKNHPDLPVLVRNRGPFRHWYGSWDKPDAPPFFAAAKNGNIGDSATKGPSGFAGVYRIARYQSERILLGVAYLPNQYANDTRYGPLPDGPQALARAVNLAVKDFAGPWDGLVLDLRMVPVPRISQLLAGVTP